MRKATRTRTIEIWNNGKEIIYDMGHFEAFKWVLKARDKGGFYYAKNKSKIAGLCVEDGHIVCTDGHRVHALLLEDEEIKNYQPGLYEVIKEQQAKIILGYIGKEPFPPWQNLFPKHDSYEKMLKDIHINKHMIHGAYARIIRELYEKAGINYNFLLDMEGEWNIYYYGDNKGLVFESKYDNRMGLIMPMRG